jgi:hypothetical protein
MEDKGLSNLSRHTERCKKASNTAGKREDQLGLAAVGITGADVNPSEVRVFFLEPVPA